MSSFFNEVIVEERHEYPFLGEHSFSWRTGEFEPELLHQVVGMYLGRHLMKNATKKGSSSSEVLESLVNDIARSNGNDLTGMGSSLQAIASKLQQGNEVTLAVRLTNVSLHLKRFGTCVGIRATDARDCTHKDATEILEQMASLSTQEGGYDYLTQFVSSRSIIVPRWQAYKNNKIDVSAEITSLTRYAPDISWSTNVVDIANSLREDYARTDHSNSRGRVEVGRYHDIPVYARIMFGKTNDRTWRKGAVTCTGPLLIFDTDTLSDDCPEMRYSVQIADGDTFGKAKADIDYECEQVSQHRLAKVLLGALKARDLAESIVINPHFVAWKRNEVQEMAVT